MNDFIILNSVKLMLAHRSSSFCIRTVIYILENSRDTSDISNNNRLFTTKLKNVEIQELISLNVSQDLFVKADEDCKADHTYQLTAYGTTALFTAKVSSNKKNKLKEDKVNGQVEDAFNVWHELIGSDKNIFKRTPTLTKSKGSSTSKGGRFNTLLKAFKQGYLLHIDEVRAVCLGCRTSLYHMGYTDQGIKKNKKFCDIQSLFSSRQRIEDLMERASGDDYTDQLIKLEDMYSFMTPSPEAPATIGKIENGHEEELSEEELMKEFV